MTVPGHRFHFRPFLGDTVTVSQIPSSVTVSLIFRQVLIVSRVQRHRSCPSFPVTVSRHRFSPFFPCANRSLGTSLPFLLIVLGDRLPSPCLPLLSSPGHIVVLSFLHRSFILRRIVLVVTGSILLLLPLPQCSFIPFYDCHPLTPGTTVSSSSPSSSAFLSSLVPDVRPRFDSPVFLFVPSLFPEASFMN